MSSVDDMRSCQVIIAHSLCIIPDWFCGRPEESSFTDREMAGRKQIDNNEHEKATFLEYIVIISSQWQYVLHCSLVYTSIL